MRTSLPDTTPCVGPLGSVMVPVTSKLPEYRDPVCLIVISIAPLPRLGLLATHVPTHLPVTSTVGAVVAGPTPPAHPPAASTTRTTMTAERLFMTDLLFLDLRSSRSALSGISLLAACLTACDDPVALLGLLAAPLPQRAAPEPF